MADTSVLKRMATILDLFSETCHSVTVEEISGELAVSMPTAFRYVADLCDIGLLAKMNGRYSLGPKIIELEYLVRYYDPIITTGEDLMSGLADMTGCHVLFCRMYGASLVNVFHAPGRQELNLVFSLFAKGRPLPRFRGAPAMSVMPFLEKRKLRLLYETHKTDTAAMQHGADWNSFSETMRAIKKRGYYVSRGELDKEANGIGAPVFSQKREVIGSLTLAYKDSAPPWMNESALAQILIENAKEMSRRISKIPPEDHRDGSSVMQLEDL